MPEPATKEDFEGFKKEISAQIAGIGQAYIDLRKAMIDAQIEAQKKLPEMIKLLSSNPELVEQKAKADEVHKLITGMNQDFIQLNANIQTLYAELQIIKKAKK